MKVKKILTIMVVCFSGLILWPATAKATLVSSNSIVQDGIEYYIETDKAVYDLGEDVQILYRITSLRDEELRVRGLASVQDFFVAQGEGQDFNERRILI